MNIRIEEGNYLVESSSRKGIVYKVYPEQPFCSCPAFRFQQLRGGGGCKHIFAVKEYIQKHGNPSTNGQIDLDTILEEIRNAESADALTFAEKYGEQAIDDLKFRGDIIEEHGKLRIV